MCVHDSVIIQKNLSWLLEKWVEKMSSTVLSMHGFHFVKHRKDGIQ